MSVGVVLMPVAPGVGLGDAGVPGGCGGAAIAAVVVAESLAAKSSATVSVIVKLPELAYVCDAVGDAAEVSAVPSPQLHVYVVIVPTLSVELAPLTVTCVPACAEYGPPELAVGPTINGADAVSPVGL